MLKFIFRLLFIGLALFVFYTFGVSAAKTIWYRATGTVVEGRVCGFLAGRNTPSVQQESTGVRKGKRKARRPVYRYPVAASSSDSLTGRSNVSTLFTFSQFNMDESVTVVFDPDNPQDSYIFNWQLILMSLLVILLGVYMLAIGLGGRVG